MKACIKKTTLAILITLLIPILLAACGKTSKDPADADIPTETAESTELAAPGESPTPALVEEIIIIGEITEPDQEQEIEDEYDLPDAAPHPLQIVFLGESNLDNYRDETGVAYLVGKQADARIYNLSIHGTTAAIYGEGDHNLKSLVGIAEILAGSADAAGIDGTRATAIYNSLNIEETDYFVIMYGAQDYMKGIPLDGPAPDYGGGTDTFVGALRKAIFNLRQAAPLADIILCSPHYSQFYDRDGYYMGDAYILSNGHSFLEEYRGKMEWVSGADQTIFINAFRDLGIDIYTVNQYLEDGVHLSEEGRRLYAGLITQTILENEKP
jgi:lysophospholipase L1-like esterase